MALSTFAATASACADILELLLEAEVGYALALSRLPRKQAWMTLLEVTSKTKKTGGGGRKGSTAARRCTWCNAQAELRPRGDHDADRAVNTCGLLC